MARWRPDAQKRLAPAALDLFAEHGYENTTVIEIAERAGLSKSTFFRHFPDKREVLSGGDTMARLLVEGIAGAPEHATPLEAIAHALDAAGQKVFVPASREFGARRRAVIAASAELQEREALKGLALVAAMADAIQRRGVADMTAQVAAQTGALALKFAYDRWLEQDNGAEFGQVARRTLAELQAAAAASQQPLLDHVQVTAPQDCEAEARGFYGQLLGLTELEKPESLRSRGGVWFAIGDHQLHVGVETPFAPALKAHPAFRWSDDDELRAIAARLSAAGAPVRWDEELPGVRRFFSSDPWGNRLEFLATAS